MNLAALLLNLLISAVTILAVMLVALGVALRRGRHDGIDTVWGLGFAVVALVTLAFSDGNPETRLVITAMTVIWGVRLAVYIHSRNHRRPEDPRYVALLRKSTGNPVWFAFRKIYLTQGVIMWLVSLPVQAAQYETASFGVLGYLGVVVWLAGLGFEAVGDWQLARFKADPANQGKIMDRGLWRYTRHPNYFGDAAVWWGLFLVACEHWIGVITVVSPVVMTLFLAKGTGKPLTEKAMSGRPGYADYVRRTSGFFPLPPRKEGTR